METKTIATVAVSVLVGVLAVCWYIGLFSPIKYKLRETSSKHVVFKRSTGPYNGTYKPGEGSVCGYQTDDAHVVFICTHRHNLNLVHLSLYTLCLDTLQCTQTPWCVSDTGSDTGSVSDTVHRQTGDGVSTPSMWLRDPIQCRLGERLILIGHLQPRFCNRLKPTMLSYTPSDGTWQQYTPPSELLYSEAEIYKLQTHGMTNHRVSRPDPVSCTVLGDTLYCVRKGSETGHAYSHAKGWGLVSLPGCGLETELGHDEYDINMLVGWEGAHALVMQVLTHILSTVGGKVHCVRGLMKYIHGMSLLYCPSNPKRVKNQWTINNGGHEMWHRWWDQGLYAWDALSGEWSPIPFEAGCVCPRMSMGVPLLEACAPGVGAWVVHRTKSDEQGKVDAAAGLSVLEIWTQEG
ncbi:hypothetical protein KIPB_000692 [Kipferlia bialata]|uniref:Uncharacterized protein n=1 Tax=Kipferlia bialata TaxID=797122 RepID=A0A9K3CPJ4_9EUKA|nr:hypothetical protein KIPB_000692 [Kipferlia bialata]|eukprot:g692.t1